MPRPQPRLLLGDLGRARILVPKPEKQLLAALAASDAAGVEEVARVPACAQLAGALAGLLYLGSDNQKAAQLLEEAAAAHWGTWGVWDHEFMRKHFSSAEYQVDLAFEQLGVAVLLREGLDLSVNTLKLGLSLALEQVGDLPRAVQVGRELERRFLVKDLVRLVLADQYLQLGDHAAILSLTEGVTNRYNYAALLCVYRGAAARMLGDHAASLEAFREALKSEQRLPTIRLAALAERSRTHEAMGYLVAARRDLKRILAEKPSLAGIQERLEALGG